jgi:two-component system response regulator NreC
MGNDINLRILLADDHKIMREGLRSLLDEQAGMEVIAEADNGRKALRLCRELLPDLVIMDITMPDLNGIEATRQIIAECPGVKVVGLSVHSDRQFVKGMLQAGASGYLLKDCSFREVLAAIEAAVAKQIYLSPQVAKYLVEGFVNESSEIDTPFSPLTARQREVLQLLAEGKSRSQVADILNISPRTVETHRRSVMDKLGIENTSELIRVAIREGLISLEP